MELTHERVEVAPDQTVAPECLDVSNSMRHLPEGDREARLACLQKWAAEGVVIRCVGPRPGLHHPICQLPEMTKQHAGREVREIMQARQALLGAQ